MKKVLLISYLILEFLAAGIWFVIGTFFYLLFFLSAFNPCTPEDGLPIFCSLSLSGTLILSICSTLFYFFISGTFVLSIISTIKLIKEKPLTKINKISLPLMVIIEILLILEYLSVS